MKQGAVLRSIGFVLGHPTDVSALPEAQKDPDLADTLRHLGATEFAVSEASVTEMAGASCQQTLGAAQAAPDQVQAFVFASTSFVREDTYRQGMRRLHASLGLQSAYPVGLFGSECANLPVALRLAADTIGAGHARQVLTVTSDRAEAGSRLMDGMAAVFSDGAASCLVCAGGERGFLVEAITLHVSTTMAEVNPKSNLMAYLKGAMNGAVETVQRCMSEVGASPSDFKRIICGNYNRSVLRTYASQLKLSEAQIGLVPGPSHGHAYAADGLIGLKRAVESGQLLPGDRCLILGTGPNTWGAVALRVLQPES